MRKKKEMNMDYCDFCDSKDVRLEKVSMTYKRKGNTYHFKDVDAFVCQKCGHRYYDASTLDKLDRMIESQAA
jgi:YgiT-type zinc finger domain-containing protein